ncbi:MAG: DUF58 domain-containing protein [Myxococcaceae bacterium]
MEGVLSGLHKSPHQGQSVEFSEHKEYAPGDELRHLDWKAFGKFDRYYVKRYEHETNLKATLVIDASGSMGYRTGALSKLEVATTLAGTLAYLLVRQQDAVGVSVVTRAGAADVPPRAAAGHLHTVLDALDGLQPAGGTDLHAAAEHLAERVRRGQLVMVFSDLFDDREEALGRILALRARRNDLAIFHVLDPAELEFPFDDPTLFLSLEDERKIEVNAREIRESYLEEFKAFLERTRATCAEADVDYALVRTDEPLDAVLLRFLGRRQRRAA